MEEGSKHKKTVFASPPPVARCHIQFFALWKDVTEAMLCVSNTVTWFSYQCDYLENATHLRKCKQQVTTFLKGQTI